jgi:hypothetical protein
MRSSCLKGWGSFEASGKGTLEATLGANSQDTMRVSSFREGADIIFGNI